MMQALIALALLAALAAALYAMRRGRRLALRYWNYLQTQPWNARQLGTLLGSSAVIEAPSGWSASSDLLVHLALEVQTRCPLQVLELGSGLSTSVIAAALRQRGMGRLVSLDHDAEFGAATIDRVQRLGLAEWAEVRIAPLTTVPGAPALWYPPEAFDDLRSIDLVFVDGPPGRRGVEVRGTALHLLWPRLKVGGVMVFDDADRREESEAVRRWASQTAGAELEYIAHLKGTLILKKTLE